MKIIKKIFKFFFPKNFMKEIHKGVEIGKGKQIGGGLFNAGKLTRKIIDPKHKMKIGKGEK